MHGHGHTIKLGAAPYLEWKTGIAIPDGATAELRIGEEGWDPVLVDSSPTIVDASIGQVGHQFTTAETIALGLGNYSVELWITPAGGEPVVYPSGAYQSLRVIDAIG